MDNGSEDKLQRVLNHKLADYFHRNDVFVGYLKITKFIYMNIKRFTNKEKRQNYELFLKEIDYLIDKQLKEENDVKNIVRIITQKMCSNDLEGLEEICYDFLETLDFYIRSITTCDRYISCCSAIYQITKKNLNLPYHVVFETVESEKEVNDYNHKQLLKALNNKNMHK